MVLCRDQGQKEESLSDNDSDTCDNLSNPMVHQNVEVIDCLVMEECEWEDDGWDLIDEPVAHPHEVPRQVVGPVHVTSCTDGRSPPCVPCCEGHPRLCNPNDAQDDVGCEHLLVSGIDTVNVSLRVLSRPITRVALDALNQLCLHFNFLVILKL